VEWDERVDLHHTNFNIPNILTAFRVMFVPFFVYLILQPSRICHLIAFLLFVLASLTDCVDGYLARRLHQETEFGKFLDPLADKFLVLGAFITFIFLSEQIQVWMVLCIVSRDIVITSLRYLAMYQGKVLRTSRLAKVKTAFQMFSIVVILMSSILITLRELDLINRQYQRAAEQGLSRWEIAGSNLHSFLTGQVEGFFFGLASFLPYYLMLLTTVITIISLIRYLFTNHQLLRGPIPLVRPKKNRTPGMKA
jgi:cardiolipin synthase (CMP-forming)